MQARQKDHDVQTLIEVALRFGQSLREHRAGICRPALSDEELPHRHAVVQRMPGNSTREQLVGKS